MSFIIWSSTGEPAPQEALRSIVEAVDTWRGQPQAFVVYRDRTPYEVVSVHPTETAARAVAMTDAGWSYLGPFTPRPAADAFLQIYKPIGCRLAPLPAPVTTVVLYDARGVEVRRFAVNLEGRPPDAETDLEALFLTTSGIDKFLIPYLTRVFGAEYAANRRAEWIRD